MKFFQNISTYIMNCKEKKNHFYVKMKTFIYRETGSIYLHARYISKPKLCWNMFALLNKNEL